MCMRSCSLIKHHMHSSSVAYAEYVVMPGGCNARIMPGGYDEHVVEGHRAYAFCEDDQCPEESTCTHLHLQMITVSRRFVFNKHDALPGFAFWEGGGGFSRGCPSGKFTLRWGVVDSVCCLVMQNPDYRGCLSSATHLWNLGHL